VECDARLQLETTTSASHACNSSAAVGLTVKMHRRMTIMSKAVFAGKLEGVDPLRKMSDSLLKQVHGGVKLYSLVTWSILTHVDPSGCKLQHLPPTSRTHQWHLPSPDVKAHDPLQWRRLHGARGARAPSHFYKWLGTGAP